MRWIHWILTMVCLGVCSGCGPKAQITIKVVEVNNDPVPDAGVVVMALNSEEAGKTDRQGCYSAKWRSVSGQVDLAVRKEGYYTVGRVSHRYVEQNDHRWVPWNPTVQLLLRKLGNPVPMAVKSVRDLRIPTQNQPIGFDFQRGDWVAPHGKGITSDLILTATGTIIDRHNFKSRLIVEFSNPDDGLVRYPVPWGDDYGLRLPALAPVDGYTNYWEFFGESQLNPQTGRCEIRSNTSNDDNFYFRVRTRRSSGGEIIAVMYGKIYHPFEFEPGFQYNEQPTVSFKYYLNPDGTRNTEWDTRSNLCADPGDVGGRP